MRVTFLFATSTQRAERKMLGYLDNDGTTRIWIVSCIFLIGAGMWLSTRSSDPYGTFHLELNRLPGDDESKPPKTEWLNMGFWKDTDVFPVACRALALRLTQAAGLREGDKVLDVGHGSGESLMFLLSASSTPKLGSLTGITSLPVHYERSLARVDSLKSTGTGTETELHLGDAVFRPGDTSKHPLCPVNPSKYDVILALDCAYHFQTRQEFLSQAFERLEAGGRIGLADICFDDEALKTTSLIRLFLRMMPKENMVGMKEYVKSMEDIGYTNVELEDISGNVFPGFTSFLRKRGIQWKFFAYIVNLYAQKAGARFVIVTARKHL